MAKNIEQRKLEGLKEGVNSRVQKGTDRELALLRVAKTLLSDGTSIAKISHLTGLTEAEIKELLANK